MDLGLGGMPPNPPNARDGLRPPRPLQKGLSAGSERALRIAKICTLVELGKEQGRCLGDGLISSFGIA